MADNREQEHIDVIEPQRSHDGGTTLGGAVGNLVTFAIVAGVTSKVLNAGSKAAASFLTRRFANTEGKTLGDVGLNILRKSYPNIVESTTMQNMRASNMAYGRWAASWRQQAKAYGQMDVLESGARWKTPDVAGATKFHFNRNIRQTADFFTRPGFESRALGMVNRVVSKGMEGNISAYVADQALGAFRPREENRNPAWYNLPGHAVNFAKFSAMGMPFGMLIQGGGLKYASKLGYEAGVGGLRVAAQNSVGRANIEKALGRTAQGAKTLFEGISGLESAAAGAIVRMQSVVPRDMGSVQFYKTILNPAKHVEIVREAYKGAKAGFQRYNKMKKESSATFFDRETMGLLSRAAKTDANKGRETFLRDFYTKTNGNRQSALEYIFGLERKVDFQSELAQSGHRYLAAMKNKGATQESINSMQRGWTETSQLLGKMNVQIEPGLYKGLHGSTVDLREIMPRNLLNKAANVLERMQFRIPGASLFGVEETIRPFQFFMIPDLLRTNRYHELSGGSFFLGSNRTAHQMPYKYAGVLNDATGTEGMMAKGNYRLDTAKAGDISGIYAGGSFFHAEDGGIRRLHSPRVNYKLFSKGSWGLMADTMAWMSGHYPLRTQQVEEEGKGRGFFKRMIERFDLDDTIEHGVFGKTNALLRKYWWSPGDKHPWHIQKNMAAWESGSEAHVGQGIVEGVNSVLNDVAGSFSKIRTKRMMTAVFNDDRDFINNLDDFGAVRDRVDQLWSKGTGMHPWVQDLGRNWNIPRMLSKLKGQNDYADISRTMMDPGNGARSVHDTFLDFLTLDKIARGRAGHQVINDLGNLSESLMKKGDIGELAGSSLRIIGYGLSMQTEKTMMQEYMANMGGQITGDNMARLTKFMKTQTVSHDFDQVSKSLYKNPLHGFFYSEETPYVSTFLPENNLRGYSAAEFTAVPWGTSGRMSIKEAEAIGMNREGSLDPTPRSFDPSRSDGVGAPITPGKVVWAATIARFGKRMLGLDPAKYNAGGFWDKIGGPGTHMFVSGIIGKRALGMAGVMTAYNYMDSLVDVMPGLQGTPLGEGLTPFFADQLVKGRFAASTFADFTGITSAAKYLEGLFPGMVDSPMMRAARGVILPIWLANKVGHKSGAAGKRLHWGMLAGVALGGLQGFGTFDMTKNTQELKEVYSGREQVAIKKGRWWESSSSNYSGQRIRGFYPNWYSRLKAQASASPDQLGSPLEQMLYKPWPLFDFNPIGFLLGEPHHYAYRHYYSRPYPITSSAFQELPFVGPAAAATLGRLIAPPQLMHKEELYAQLDKYGFSTDGGFTQRMGHIPNTMEVARAFPTSRQSIRQTISSQMNEMQQMAGLWGFGLQTATAELMGFERPYEGDNVLEDSGEITSLRRSYYDKEVGGLFGYTEAWRRFVTKKQPQINKVNPLLNRMPKWLPVQFRVGDAYARVPMGEISLPGKGYTASHDVQMSFPAAASWLGLGVEDTVRKMLSMGRPEPIGREELEKVNSRIRAAGEVFEPYNDVAGNYDGIIRKGRRAILQKIKNYNTQDNMDLIGPSETDISEVNFYMRMAGVAEGVLQYRVDGVPMLTYPVQYDEQRFQKDMETVNIARRKAADLYADGVGFEGEAYSHVDRVSILANVAPYSNEFKKEVQMAKKEVAIGRGDQARLDTAIRQSKAMKMSQEFYPRRFLSKVLTPDATFNNMSLNMYMKAAADYTLPERALGALWEGFNSLNHPFDKFHSYKTPLDAYKANTLYGRSMKMWQSPFEHWADAYSRGFMSKDDPMTGALAGFIGGYSFGPLNGPASSMVGAGIGAAYGAVHGIYRSVKGGTYIPGSVQQVREISRYFDQMTYQKNMMLYDMTGDDGYLEEARSTMMGLNPSDLSRNSWTRTYRATPYMEKPYVMSFLKETDNMERQNILKVVTPELSEVLQQKWAKMDGLATNVKVAKGKMMKMPNPDWAGWSPEVNLSDVQMVTVENAGLNAHDFGLGWYEQQRRVRNSPGLPGPIDLTNMSSNTSREPVVYTNQSEMRRMIERVLKGYGVDAFITVSPSYHDNVLTVVT